jgi:hypothetical protein
MKSLSYIRIVSISLKCYFDACLYCSMMFVCYCCLCSCFQTPQKIDHIGSRVNLPPSWLENAETGDPLVPPIFILNVQVPSDFSSSFFTEITDGPGWSLVMYFKLTEVCVYVCLYVCVCACVQPVICFENLKNALFILYICECS